MSEAIQQNEGVVSSTTLVRCRATRLHETIPKLSPAQCAAVKKIGFGGILDLKFSIFPTSAAQKFLDCFNDGTCMFRVPGSKGFKITKEDVHDCFLLPLGPKVLDLVPTAKRKGSDSTENKALKDRWKKRFDSSGKIVLGKIKTAIEADVEGGDDFCTLWVLLCMSSFLAPTSDDGVDFKLLRAAENVGDIPNYDWCSYVLDAIVAAGESSRERSNSLMGCIPFLMITYFQRFDYRGQVCPYDLPLLKHWDELRLKNRINGELGDGGLGRQIESMVQYPRCIYASKAPVLLEEKEKEFFQIESPPGFESFESDTEADAEAIESFTREKEARAAAEPLIASLVHELDKVRQEKMASDDKVKRLQEYNANLRHYNSSLQTDLATANATLQRVEKEKSTILENLGTLRGHYASLQEQLTTSRETCSSQRQQLEELNQQLGLANEKLKMADLYVSETRTNYEEQQQLIRQLKDRLAEAEIQIDEKELLRRKLQELKANLLKLIPTVDA